MTRRIASACLAAAALAGLPAAAAEAAPRIDVEIEGTATERWSQTTVESYECEYRTEESGMNRAARREADPRREVRL